MQVSTLMVVAALGSLLTPYGTKLHIYIASLAAATKLNARIDELAHPHFSFMQFQLFIVLLIVLAIALLRQPRAVRLADILQVMVLSVATLLAARFVVLGGAVSGAGDARGRRSSLAECGEKRDRTQSASAYVGDRLGYFSSAALACSYRSCKSNRSAMQTSSTSYSRLSGRAITS